MPSILMSDPRRLADFAGAWTLVRKIAPKNGVSAQFQGKACWTPKNGGLAYVETGIMTFEGQTPMQAERRYFWADDLSVYFDDGRFFHRVPADGGTADHWCDPDSYHVTYKFSRWPNFEVIWDVKGPRKYYRSVTVYSRG